MSLWGLWKNLYWARPESNLHLSVRVELWGEGGASVTLFSSRLDEIQGRCCHEPVNTLVLLVVLLVMDLCVAKNNTLHSFRVKLHLQDYSFALSNQRSVTFLTLIVYIWKVCVLDVFCLPPQFGQSEGVVTDASRCRHQSSCQSLAAAPPLDSQSDGRVLQTGQCFWRGLSAEMRDYLTLAPIQNITWT